MKKVLFLAGMLTCSSCSAAAFLVCPNTLWKSFVCGVTLSAKDVVRNVIGCGVVTAVSAGVASWWLPGNLRKYIWTVAGALFVAGCAHTGYKYRFVEVLDVADIGKHVNEVVVVNNDVTSLEAPRQSNAITQHIYVQGGNRLKRIGAGVFYNFMDLQSIIIPNGVRIIDDFAFADCGALTIINLYNVETIGEDAFARCHSLVYISLFAAKQIGCNAFFSCQSLTNISAHEVENIGDDAFAQCSRLTSINCPRAKSIGRSTFTQCDSLSNFDFTSVESIGSGAFAHCRSLRRVSFPHVKKISWSAFAECDYLRSVSFPNIKRIGKHAFSNCSYLTDIDLHNVEKIGHDAFTGCTRLQTVTLPIGVEIKQNAFQGTGLSAVHFSGVVPEEDQKDFLTAKFRDSPLPERCCVAFLNAAGGEEANWQWVDNEWRKIEQY
ncbi:MAG: leucine-rich repeat domain-containing protein [Holosporales bacterium]|jgi:hypothetical protein|nr:leucine-rich repeat domain-containing protein [Holosporales bacterium]